MAETSGQERVLVLVKALPHVSERHGEAVCCAGVTPDRTWRRQFPIHYRTLEKKFTRWQWITYNWRKPVADNRLESRSVQEDTLVAGGMMPKRERADFLNPLIVPTTDEATAKGQTLALVRPVTSRFSFTKKTSTQIEGERKGYASVANQKSFFDKELNALDPCPYAFQLDYCTEDGKAHSNLCGDWETAAMFYKWNALYGEDDALERMNDVFNHDYPKKGMVLALGTHSRYPTTWLLVGIIRLDPVRQLSLIV